MTAARAAVGVLLSSDGAVLAPSVRSSVSVRPRVRRAAAAGGGLPVASVRSVLISAPGRAMSASLSGGRPGRRAGADSGVRVGLAGRNSASCAPPAD